MTAIESSQRRTVQRLKESREGKKNHKLGIKVILASTTKIEIE